MIEGTYELTNGGLQPYQPVEGYQVSIQNIPFNSQEQTLAALSTMQAVINQPLYVGYTVEWGYELSVHIKDREQAVAVAKAFDQQAIWDWSVQECIYL